MKKMTDKEKLKRMITPIVEEIIREQIEQEVKQVIISTLLETNLISKIIEETVQASKNVILENYIPQRFDDSSHESSRFAPLPMNVRESRQQQQAPDSAKSKYARFVEAGGIGSMINQSLPQAAQAPAVTASELEKKLNMPGIFAGTTADAIPQDNRMMESAPSAQEAGPGMPDYMLREIAKFGG
jgi:hypothetical protein